MRSVHSRVRRRVACLRHTTTCHLTGSVLKLPTPKNPSLAWRRRCRHACSPIPDPDMLRGGPSVSGGPVALGAEPQIPLQDLPPPLVGAPPLLTAPILPTL